MIGRLSKQLKSRRASHWLGGGLAAETSMNGPAAEAAAAQCPSHICLRGSLLFITITIMKGTAQQQKPCQFQICHTAPYYLFHELPNRSYRGALGLLYVQASMILQKTNRQTETFPRMPFRCLD